MPLTVNNYRKQFFLRILKLLISVCIFTAILGSLHSKGLSPYYCYDNSVIQNEFYPEEAISLKNKTVVSQSFTAKGKFLNNVSVYLGESPDTDIQIEILDPQGASIVQKNISTQSYTPSQWVPLGLESTVFKSGTQYTIIFSSNTDLSCLYLDQGESHSDLGTAFSHQETLTGSLAIELSFTNVYLIQEDIIKILVQTVLVSALSFLICLAIWNAEKLLKAYRTADHKISFLYAFYFALSLILLFNPLNAKVTEVSEFNRTFGAGILANMDVSKRTNQFTFWFLLFSAAFILIYLLINSYKQSERSDESKKAELFLDHFMVLANCTLAFRCILYFKQETNVVVFSFISNIILLIALVGLLYVLLQLDRFISADNFAKFCLIGAAVSYSLCLALTSAISAEGILLILITYTAALILFCVFGNKIISCSIVCSGINSGVLLAAALPLLTSAYIELLHILNQYGIIVSHPRRHYLIACIFAAFVWVIMSAVFLRRKITIPSWKNWTFPILILGVACLSEQIRLTTSYTPDLLESANFGILINDFLNFGKIPNIEHYGGHMMTSVWEGVLYGLINQDYTGAFMSPYAGMADICLIVLFYFLAKDFLGKPLALMTTLLFPFYSVWYYHGLGMLICLAAVSFIRKPTYIRAIVFWGAFIWCVLYRLDAGFAFGMAAVVSLVIYALLTRNQQAIKQLILTIIGWGILGVALWFGLCIAKGIHPIRRLMEFLYVNLSNLNWAYFSIGNPDITAFSWLYITIPLAVIVSLIHLCFSSSFRRKIGMENWLSLLIFGFAYIFNFSRGLVRHSLWEGVTYFSVFSAYIFLAFYFASCKNNRKFFLPILTALILCDTLVLTNANFSASTVAEKSVSQSQSVVSEWNTLTQSNAPAQRVVFSDSTRQYAEKFSILNQLLEEDETFVDFINKTILYALMNKECPVYVSQSPLQLSGEFMQREFIEQIKGVPVILMPIDAQNYLLTSDLDDVPNVYRYYLVAEYIYQNYVPLLQYADDYAIWCLPERYEAYQAKLDQIVIKTSYDGSTLNSSQVKYHNAKVVQENRKCVITTSESISSIDGLQNVIDLSPFIGADAFISMEYDADCSGLMELFYTQNPDKPYSDKHVSSAHISGQGTAEFTVPVTAQTALRLNMPSFSTVKISSIQISQTIKSIVYGYDGPKKNISNPGIAEFKYISLLHNYPLQHLPRIWAEFDKKNAAENKTLTFLVKQNDIYCIPSDEDVISETGNYLKITARYDGNDIYGTYQPNDESLPTVVVLGFYQNGQFEEKAKFSMIVQEGTHDYLLRCSADYYWHLGQINAVRILEGNQLYDVKISILEGD